MYSKIRTIDGSVVTAAVSSLYSRACTEPDETVEILLGNALLKEPPGPGRDALEIELENFRVARDTGLPICQDTGTALVFIEIGSMVCITNGTLHELVNEGIRRACLETYLRPSQVFPPLTGRVNTKDNTPALLYLDQVEGNSLRISVMAKGAGCENVSRSEMLPPLAGEMGIADLAERCVLSGASKACPPVILGIGIGGNLETSGILAKKALLRKPGVVNSDPDLAGVEARITGRMNSLGIGPQGFGGSCTVLETRILELPCHMASLPVSVCVECHAHRTASCLI